ncbi:YeiH family protein [Pontibacter sp. CAU 1760]
MKKVKDDSRKQTKHPEGALDRRITTRQLLFLLFVVLCLTPYISAPFALLLGVVVAQFIGHPFLHLNHKATHLLLQVSVVGLGFGMNGHAALVAGKSGLLLTVVSIAFTLVLGTLLGKWLGIEQKTTHLITAGTAICGGSAIAALSPLVGAGERRISVALGTVFILNAVALFLFPAIGRYLGLSQAQFGLWCAIAIHDTSSVVGAASKYGPQALEVATTVKLARALWIIPLSLATAYAFKNKAGHLKFPYFILAFVLAMLANTYLPMVQQASPFFVQVAKAGLTLTLFLIGAGLSRKALKAVGAKPLLLGVLLWAAISALSLRIILH